MFNSEALTEKWSPVLAHEGAGAIKDNYRKAVTAVLLENTEKQLREERGMINEASNTVGAISGDALSGSGLTTKTGGLAGFDPVMISLIRRAMPNLVAYDICGVQPMSGPTGLIFAMKSHYQQNGAALRAVRRTPSILADAPVLISLGHHPIAPFRLANMAAGAADVWRTFFAHVGRTNQRRFERIEPTRTDPGRGHEASAHVSRPAIGRRPGRATSRTLDVDLTT